MDKDIIFELKADIRALREQNLLLHEQIVNLRREIDYKPISMNEYKRRSTYHKYKFTAEEIADMFPEFKMTGERIRELATEGYAPCMVRLYDKEPLFSKYVMQAWLERNAFVFLEGVAVFNIKHPFYNGSNSKRTTPTILKGVENIEELKDCIKPACVYFLVLREELVYVGKSENLSARIASHRKDPEKVFDRVFYIKVANDKLDYAEKYYISMFNPSLNKRK